MSWVTDIASGLGIPTGAATIAAAMYGACVAAESSARPEALKEISQFLQNPSLADPARPSVVIDRIFRWTFGERHLSLKCIWRSFILTFVIFIAVSLTGATIVGWSHVKPPPDIPTVVFGVPMVIILVVGLPDYFSLWKTRLLLSYLRGRRGLFPMIALVFSDIFLSLILSLIFVLGMDSMVDGWAKARSDLSRILRSFVTGDQFLTMTFFVISTLFTSLWTQLVVVSAAVLKTIAPLRRFTAWFFDVDKHPVQAIGIMSGALVMLGSLAWSVARALI